eukprot:753396-Hanusia_phi.AAC.2
MVLLKSQTSKITQETVVKPSPPSTRFHPSEDDARHASSHQPPSLKGIESLKSTLPHLEQINASPRVFRIRNLLTKQECEHLMLMAFRKGLSKTMIMPYGTHKLVESSTRTNDGAWLEFLQDDVVRRLEETLGKLTKTTPQQGENLQILHYSNGGQYFQEHYDYFDPARDPPESFEQGGNRYITVIVYLEAALEGGETYFPELGLKLTAAPGDALMFYNLKEHCSGTDPDCVEKKTLHAALPPVRGEKWVAVKWIHEKPYQKA